MRRRNRDGAADGLARCRLCGQAVPVTPDGRCPLGHAVAPPPAASGLRRVPAPDAPAAGPETPAAVRAVEPETPAAVPAGERSPVPARAVGDAGAAAAAAGHTAAARAEAPEPQAEPATAVGAGTPPSPAGDLAFATGWFGDLTDVHAEAGDLLGDLEPAHQPAAGADASADAESAFGDLLAWDAPLESALDASLPDPPHDPAGSVPPDGEADEREEAAPPPGEAAEPVDEDEADDRRVARRRAAGIVGGTIAAVAAVVGSVLVLPL